MPSKSTLLLRALKRRCPRCGGGRLYHRWIRLHDECESCGLQFLQNQGDAWAFQVLTDRLFLIPPIVWIYFGYPHHSTWSLALAIVAIASIFIVTMPHRYAIAVAIDYYSRVRWQESERTD